MDPTDHRQLQSKKEEEDWCSKHIDTRSSKWHLNISCKRKLTSKRKKDKKEDSWNEHPHECQLSQIQSGANKLSCAVEEQEEDEGGGAWIGVVVEMEHQKDSVVENYI